MGILPSLTLMERTSELRMIFNNFRFRTMISIGTDYFAKTFNYETKEIIEDKEAEYEDEDELYCLD